MTRISDTEVSVQRVCELYDKGWSSQSLARYLDSRLAPPADNCQYFTSKQAPPNTKYRASL
jgi:hypothetical protein